MQVSWMKMANFDALTCKPEPEYDIASDKPEESHDYQQNPAYNYHIVKQQLQMDAYATVQPLSYESHLHNTDQHVSMVSSCIAIW